MTMASENHNVNSPWNQIQTRLVNKLPFGDKKLFQNHIAPEFQAVIEDVDCEEGDTVNTITYFQTIFQIITHTISHI